MQHYDQTRSLFILQTQLVEGKIDMVVNKSIHQVVEQIVELRYEMHHEISGLRSEMHTRFSSLEGRMIAVETALGMRNQKQNEMRSRFLDYSFKAGWLVGLTVLSGVISFLTVLFLES